MNNLFTPPNNAKLNQMLIRSYVIEGEALVLIVFGWMYLNVLFGLSPIFYHSLTVVIISLALYKWSSRNIKLNWKFIIPLLVSVLIPSAFNQDIKGLLAGWSYFIGFMCYFILFFDKNISMKIVIKSMMWIVIPGYLLSVFIVGEGPRVAMQSNPSVLIPLAVNTYRVNIGPVGTTVHFSAEIAFLTLIVSLYHLKEHRIYIIIFILSVYLFIFSGARSIYYSAICVILILLIIRAQNEKLTLYFILLLAVSIYGVGILQEIPFKSDGVIGELSKMNNHNQDLGSGRSWLWALHMDQFFQQPLIGIGRNGMDLLFQNWDLEALPASSESYYTAQLATYGIFGSSFLFMMIWVIKKAIAKKRKIAIIFSAHMLIGTISNSTYGGITSVFLPIVLSLVASSLRGAPFVLNAKCCDEI